MSKALWISLLVANYILLFIVSYLLGHFIMEKDWIWVFVNILNMCICIVNINALDDMKKRGWIE